MYMIENIYCIRFKVVCSCVVTQKTQHNCHVCALVSYSQNSVLCAASPRALRIYCCTILNNDLTHCLTSEEGIKSTARAHVLPPCVYYQVELMFEPISFIYFVLFSFIALLCAAINFVRTRAGLHIDIAVALYSRIRSSYKKKICFTYLK